MQFTNNGKHFHHNFNSEKANVEYMIWRHEYH
jgi:hypothetical protein